MNPRLIIILLVVLFILGCAKEKEPELQSSQEKMVQEDAPAVKPVEQVSVAEDNNEEEQLANIAEMQAAIRSMDEVNCQNVAEDLVSDCVDRIRLVKASKNKDINMCESIGSEQIRYECKKEVAALR
ncbi:hypothetical protein JXA85_03470 [Candidatus Woesearchaeota archaeon]|nr:hypothetical protein [Candidatus Woesearchaeota archaeon]